MSYQNEMKENFNAKFRPNLLNRKAKQEAFRERKHLYVHDFKGQKKSPKDTFRNELDATCFTTDLDNKINLLKQDHCRLSHGPGDCRSSKYYVCVCVLVCLGTGVYYRYPVTLHTLRSLKIELSSFVVT